MTELSSEYAEALMLKVYGLTRTELGKITQRHFNELLENIGGVIVFEQTGKIVDKKMERKRDKENLEWARKLERGELNG